MTYVEECCKLQEIYFYTSTKSAQYFYRIHKEVKSKNFKILFNTSTSIEVSNKMLNFLLYTSTCGRSMEPLK